MLRTNREFTCAEIADNFACCRKTIVRDIAFLGQLGYDIEYDVSAQKYRLFNAPAPAL